MDSGFELFSGLNVLPKDSALSSYSYRTNRQMNRKFLRAMLHRLKRLGLLSGEVNMDFKAIPHWGEASVLKNNWSGKYGKRLKSVLAALRKDPDTWISCYSDAEVKHHNQPECVLEFVDFWREKVKKPSCLIFDSKFTSYQNLEKLDKYRIKFITLRRRSKKLLSEIGKIPKGEWKGVRVEGPGRKHERVMIHEAEIILNKTTRSFKQIIVSGNGHEKEKTLTVTNGSSFEVSKYQSIKVSKYQSIKVSKYQNTLVE